MIFSYFFQVGAGLGLGLVAVGIPSVLLWRRINRGKAPSESTLVRRGAR